MMIGLSRLVWTAFEGQTSDAFEGQTSDTLWRTSVRRRRPRRLILPGAFTLSAQDSVDERAIGESAMAVQMGERPTG